MDRKLFDQDQAVADEKAEVAQALAKKHYQAEEGLQVSAGALKSS